MVQILLSTAMLSEDDIFKDKLSAIDAIFLGVTLLSIPILILNLLIYLIMESCRPQRDMGCLDWSPVFNPTNQHRETDV